MSDMGQRSRCFDVWQEGHIPSQEKHAYEEQRTGLKMT